MHHREREVHVLLPLVAGGQRLRRARVRGVGAAGAACGCLPRRPSWAHVVPPAAPLPGSASAAAA